MGLAKLTQRWVDRRWRQGWRFQSHVLGGRFRILDAERRVVLRSADESEAINAWDGLVQDQTGSDELVLVLHGLGRTSLAMRPMARALRGFGWQAAAFDYPSTRQGVEANGEQLLELIRSTGVRRVSFVTHSLGGIIARAALASERWPEGIEAGRLVMLAPPSTGSSLAERLSSPPLRALLGPAFSDVSGSHRVPPPAIPFGIVAGTMGSNPLIAGVNDGVVSVEETRLPGATAFTEVAAAHTWIMNLAAVQAWADAFLRGEAPGDLG